MPLLYPLIAWGSADDLSAWTDFNTPIITAGQTDPFGGTGAYLVNDNDGTLTEGKTKAVTFTKNGRQWFTWFLKAGTSSTVTLELYDSTAAAVRVRGGISWSGGVPSIVVSSGAGAVLTPIAVGGSWYFLRVAADNIVAANTNLLRLFPTDAAVGSQTGTVYAYRRSCILVDVLDDVAAYPEPRDGSDWVQGPSGTEDAWITGTDYRFDGTIRHVPASPTDTPVAKSGWDGVEEYLGVNTGVGAFLTAGRNKSSVRFCPDRTALSTYIDGYLVEPLRGAPGLENDFSRTVRIGLRGSSPYAGYV